MTSLQESTFKTVLTDYVLWFDGSVTIEPSQLEKMFLSGVDQKNISVTEITNEVKKYNALSSDKLKIKTEIDADLIIFDWNIPIKYLDIDVTSYFLVLLVTHKNKYTSEEFELREKRVDLELSEYSSRGLTDVLKVLIYVIDLFMLHGVVWGVGRGSSCASYILFLLRVHSVDSVKFDIPISEFLK